MLAMLKTLFSQRRLEICPTFFLRGRTAYQGQKVIGKACKDAGLQGKLFHDLRRTAIRNLVLSGVSETVCWLSADTGHRSAFQRDDIMSERDLMEVRRGEKHYINGQEQSVNGQSSGKVIPFQQKEANRYVG